MRRLLLTILALFFILYPARFYTQFKAAAAPIPPGVLLGGLDLSALHERDTIAEHLASVYSQPIAVYLGDERFTLSPADVDFNVEVDLMIAEASEYLHGPDFVDIALRHALGFDQRTRNVPVHYTMNGDKLRAWLDTVASEQQQGESSASTLPALTRWTNEESALSATSSATGGSLPAGFVGAVHRDWRWQPSAPTFTFDMDASTEAVIDALASRDAREATLIVDYDAEEPVSFADLERALDNYLSTFPGFAAVYVEDLTTGETARVDADVSFSGMSTMKIGIVAAMMDKLDGLPAGNIDARETGQLMDLALGESNNTAANLLLARLGDGDTAAGARRFTNFARDLGLESTYMQTGYDAGRSAAQLATPGNTREDWDTNPDPNLQSTPADMGHLLAAIYRCAQGEGPLLERFNTFTPEECQYVLFYMAGDEFQELLWAGVPQPDSQWFVHKHGFAYETHSDVALVWGPGGPYVISVFLYRSGWLDWPTSNGSMKAISRMTWNFFELRAQQLDIERPVPIALEQPPVYVPIGARGNGQIRG